MSIFSFFRSLLGVDTRQDKSDFSPVEKRKKGKPLVWNDDEVKLSTVNGNGEYTFENFSGNIFLYDEKCVVENASFVYRVGNMGYIKGTCLPHHPWDKMANRIVKFFGGVVREGELSCDTIENSVVDNAAVFCDYSTNNTVNNGRFYCGVWNKGTVNGGEIECHNWKCGIFNDGVFKGEHGGIEKNKWHEGVFNGGVFKGKWCGGVFNGGVFNGEWYGGKWHDGQFRGESFVGDGTFDSVEKV